MGQVLTAGQGQNPARQAAVAAGIPIEATAWGVNQVCGSGLRAVALGAQQIETGDADIIVAGGQESMSLAPHVAHLRNGRRWATLKLIDTMIKDGLWDAFNGYHMGTTAENVASQWQITRDEQDEFAAASQNKAEAAQKAGKFKDEIVAGHGQDPQGRRRGRARTNISAAPRSTDAAKLAPGLRQGGHGHRRQRLGHQRRRRGRGADDREEAKKRGIEPLARIASWATAGVDPSIMGSGPIPASRKALEKAGWKVSDLDLIEANEAFAAQASR